MAVCSDEVQKTFACIMMIIFYAKCLVRDMNKRIYAIGISVLLPLMFAINGYAQNDITIEQALQRAEVNSYALTVSQYQKLAAKKAIIIAKAGYFPVLNFEAIDSWGFPGSSGWIGVEGLMGSPYRKELSGGVVAKQTLYDFGRTKYDVKRAEDEVELAKQNSKITAYEVKLLTLASYYDCAQYRTLESIWSHLSKEAEVITTEVEHFIKTGQRSVVDHYLSRIQLEEARTAQAYFGNKYKGVKRELAIMMGIDENSFSCAMLNKNTKGISDPDLCSSPFLARAKVDLQIAKDALGREKSDLMPKVVTVASLGAMEKTHLLPKKDYAVGLGVIVPLYDLHVVGGIKRARAMVSAKNEEVEAQIQFLEEMNAKYDTIINSSRVKLEHLNRELSLAEEGFKVAKRRYFDLEGQLVDLREAFRDLSKASVDTEDSRANVLKAQGSKYLLNGA